MKRFKHILYILAATAMLASCAQDDGPDVPREATQSPYVLFGSRIQPMSWETAVHSRDGNGSIPATEMPDVIGVWGYNNATGLSYSGTGEVFCNTPMFNMETNRDAAIAYGVNPDWQDEYQNNWGYYIEPTHSQLPMPWIASTAEKTVNYKFYGYAPYLETAEGYSNSYVGFNEVRLRNLPQVSSVDYMVADNIIQYTASENTALNPVQTLKMTHIYSRLQFCFKLGERYDSLRTITVKKLELINLMGLSSDLIIRFNRDALGEYVPTYLWSSSASASDTEVELDSDEPLVLNKTTFEPFASAYVCPTAGFGSLTLRVTYDVHDRDGQLLRQDDTATNMITLNMVAANGTPGPRTLDAGYYHNVNILVKPTFLYVLSDNDMGSDGAIVLK